MNSKNTQKCVALYLRSATGNEADLRRQSKLLEQEFVRRKVDFTGSSLEIYADPCSSGLKLGSNLLRLKKDIAAGKIHAVMTASMNRISRVPHEIDRFLDFLEDHGVRFISNRNVDSKSWATGGAHV